MIHFLLFIFFVADALIKLSSLNVVAKYCQFLCVIIVVDTLSLVSCFLRVL